MSTSPDVCPVCLEELVLRGGKIIINPGCGHSLHIDCYTEFINKYDTCSICKKPLSKPSPATPAAQPGPFFPSYPPAPQYPMQFAMQQQQQFQYIPPRTAFNQVIYRPEDDDPVRTDPTNSVPPPTADNSTYITLTLQSERASLTYDTDTTVICMASLEAPGPVSINSQDDVRTQATDLVMILDISGSMAGSKLTLLKETLRYVLTQLGPQDRLSLVTFSSTARKETPLWFVSEDGKVRFESAISRIGPQGGTNIGSGLLVGLQLLEQRLTKNRSTAIFLLSDGQDNEGDGWSQFVNRAKDASIPIHTFGYGNDADSRTLSLIAETSNGGTFNHIGELADVQHCFAGTLGGLLALGYQNLRVLLQAREGYSVINRVLGSYPFELDARGINAKVQLGDLYYGEKRDILVEVLVKKIDQNSDQDKGKGKETDIQSEGENTHTKIFTADCAYDDLALKETILNLPTPAILTIARHAGPNHPNTPSPAIEKQRLRLATAAAISSAVQNAESHRFADAQLVLSSAIQNAQSTLAELRESSSEEAILTPEDEAFHTALIDDLLQSRNRLTDDTTSVQGGGLASARNMQQAHQSQRANSTYSMASHYYQAPQSQYYETMSRVSRLSSIQQVQLPVGPVNQLIVNQQGGPSSQQVGTQQVGDASDDEAN